MPCDFTDIWNLKTKTNKQTKQNQTHRHREKKTDGCQMGEVGVAGCKRWRD